MSSGPLENSSDLCWRLMVALTPIRKLTFHDLSPPGTFTFQEVYFLIE